MKTNLKNGTQVITHDGELGTVVGICHMQRNGSRAYNYVVQTQYGTEICHHKDLTVFVAVSE